MFQRNSLNYLRQWRQKEGRKPLILRGARQVGKTTVISEFAKDFQHYIYLNLEREEHRLLFDKGMDIENTLKSIAFTTHTPLTDNTLLFIDEIQNSATAIQSLRYFYEQHPEICVVAAGSLLENYAGKTFSFPVGRVEFMAMHPCTFYEYLGAVGEQDDLQLIYDGNAHFVHNRLMQSFQTYTLLGGMPEVIQTYLDTRDLRAAEPIYTSLLASYQDDVEKYAANKTQAAVIRHILQYGWAMAGEIITYERFAGSTYKSREVSEAFLTLQKSMLLETVHPSSSVRLPLLPNMSRHPKLLWLDTGIVNYQAGVRDELFSAENLQDVYRGRIAEHIVGQELLGYSTQIDAHRAFWQKSEKSEAEIDYLYVFESRIIPIEVKSGANAHLRSLQQFMALSEHDVAVRVWNKPMSIDEVQNPQTGKTFRLINLPFYMVGRLDQVLKQYI